MLNLVLIIAHFVFSFSTGYPSCSTSSELQIKVKTYKIYNLKEQYFSPLFGPGLAIKLYACGYAKVIYFQIHISICPQAARRRLLNLASPSLTHSRMLKATFIYISSGLALKSM